jgi:metal-responsive CopG/Arc/MetJ family transcriptional regulator
MTIISISLDDEILKWLDQLVQRKIIKNRSEAIKGGIFSFIKEHLPFESREELRTYIKKKQLAPLQSGTEAIHSLREEE